MKVSDHFIIDCSEAPAVERFERETLTDDFSSVGYAAENVDAELIGSSDEIGNIDLDLPVPDSCAEGGITEHPLSGCIELTNSTKEFERDLLSLYLDPDKERGGKPLAGRFESGSAKPSAFFTSVLVHCSAFLLIAFFPAPQVAGKHGHQGNVISATIVAQEELVPQDESPASVDSVASMPSNAKKSAKTMEAPPKESPKAIETQEIARRPTDIAMLEKPNLLEKKEERKERQKEVTKEEEQDPRGDALRNSLASMPSTASAERRFMPAAGRGGEAFDSLILSAIREAIFFPKQAAHRREHGEVVVAFAINGDRSVLDFDIMKSSGFEILDQAAIKIIQKAAKKFPPFPDGLGTGSLRYVVPILFKEKVK
jgi:periplasmic protein TonB